MFSESWKICFADVPEISPLEHAIIWLRRSLTAGFGRRPVTTPFRIFEYLFLLQKKKKKQEYIYNTRTSASSLSIDLVKKVISNLHLLKRFSPDCILVVALKKLHTY